MFWFSSGDILAHYNVLTESEASGMSSGEEQTTRQAAAGEPCWPPPGPRVWRLGAGTGMQSPATDKVDVSYRASGRAPGPCVFAAMWWQWQWGSEARVDGTLAAPTARHARPALRKTHSVLSSGRCGGAVGG